MSSTEVLDEDPWATGESMDELSGSSHLLILYAEKTAGLLIKSQSDSKSLRTVVK